jgi:chromosome segregation ATPase
VIVDKIAEYGMSLALIVFGGGSAVKFILERRRAKVAGDVAEATAELQIDAAQLANIRAQMDLMKAAWTAERLSMQGRIASLAQELRDEREESARKEREIAKLREQVDRMQDELVLLAERLAKLSGSEDSR